MNGKLWRFAVALLPICFLSAQQPNAEDASWRVNPEGVRPPSPKEIRGISAQLQNMRARANAINDLAGRIQSLDDARKLVDLVAVELSDELPRKWASRSVRNRIARAEYEAAYDPGALIPERRVADVWNDYLKKIGAAPEVYVTPDEIHTLRDSAYVGSQLAWAHGNRNIWTVPNIYAIGQNGKVANGCRAVEVLDILWKLANDPEDLQGARERIKKGQLLSDVFKNPSNSPGVVKAHVTARVIMAPPNPVEQAAREYIRVRGARALNNAIEGLLKDLFAS